VLISKKIYHKVLKNNDYEVGFMSEVTESLDMLESVKNLSVEKNLNKRIENKLSNYLYNDYYLNSFFNKVDLYKNTILETLYFIINFYGLYLVFINHLNIVSLFTYNMILDYSLNPVKNLLSLLPKYNYIKVSINKINEFINIEKEELNDYEDLKGDIVFQNVDFSYNNYNYILKNINLSIKEKNKVFLNGKSGCGKSSICKMLYKYERVNKGNIFINEININNIDLGTIRKNILYVSQNEKLLTGSIKENILLGRDISLTKLNKVCSLCAVDEILSNKNYSYETLIEPSSKNLSGGEKQRIILARALLKNANILIFDEALSEVDEMTERLIINNILEYFKDKTIIYISHKNQEDLFDEVINLEDLNELPN